MKGQEIYQLVIKRIMGTFSPTEDELRRLEERLGQYDEAELQNLYQNFNHFGINEVLNTLYGIYFD